MTTAFVVRLDEEQAARLKSAAKKRSTTRNAIVREALDKYLGGKKARRPGHAASAKPVRKTKAHDEPSEDPMAGVPPTEPGKGVGWAQHFEWLEKHGRKINWNDVLEFEDLENNRGFR